MSIKQYTINKLIKIVNRIEEAETYSSQIFLKEFTRQTDKNTIKSIKKAITKLKKRIDKFWQSLP